MPTERQTSFASGEWAKTLWGRTDLQRYASAARLLKNYIITPHGAAASRPGTQHIESFPGVAGMRLVPYLQRDDSSALLIFANNIVRYYAWNAGLGRIAEVCNKATTYTTAELFELSMAQMGDVITICHKNHPPAELWFDGAALQLADVSFGVPTLPGKCDIPYASFDDLPTEDPTHAAQLWRWVATRLVRHGGTGNVYETMPTPVTRHYPLTASSDNWDATYAYKGVVEGFPDLSDRCIWQGGYYKNLQNGNLGHNPLNSPEWWEYIQTTQEFLDANFQLPEHLADVEIPESVVVYSDKKWYFRFLWEDDLDEEWTVIGHRLYRGREGYFGFVGESRGVVGDEKIIDEGQTPDYSINPPQGLNPFEIRAGGLLIRTENPTQVCYYEARRVFAGTPERPENAWASAVEQHTNFDIPFLPNDEHALEYQLASKRLETIKALIPRRSLLILTACSEWMVEGAGGGILTPNSIAAHAQTEHGCGNLPPLVMGDTVLFVQRKGTIPRALLFSNEAGGYQSSDLSLFARHIFDGKKLADWTWCEDPFSIVWVVRTDGSLYSLTYVREQELVAWTRHELGGGGLAEAVVSLPEGQEDVLYLVVNRGGTRMLERLSSRLFDTLADAVCLDSSVSYSGAPATTVTGLTHLEGQEVYALADGQVVGPLTVAAAAVDISDVLPEGASKIHVGLRYDVDFEPLDIAQEKGKVKLVREVLIQYSGRLGGKVAMTSDGPWEETGGRTVDEGYAVPQLVEWDELKVSVPAEWEFHGRVFLRQSAPLPITLLGIFREYEVGG